MKRCPTCKQTFADPNLIFCIDDGTPLVQIDDSNEETIVNPSTGHSTFGAQESLPQYQPPPSYQPPGGSAGKRKTWPLVLGVAAVVLALMIGAGILAAVFLPRLLRSSTSNANTNTPVPQSNTSNVAEDVNAPPPTDELQVLTDLTNLEHEWTVANINADKKALDRILADDYVGSNSEGRPQGKAEYLRTIERDQSIQKWNFEDLKVALIGSRATLTGILRIQVQNQEAAFRFTDKFVWRDGRWQATGSEVSRVE